MYETLTEYHLWSGHNSVVLTGQHEIWIAASACTQACGTVGMVYSYPDYTNLTIH